MTGVGLNAAYYANSYNGAISYTGSVYSSQYQDGLIPTAEDQAEQADQHQEQTQQQMAATMLQLMLTLLQALIQKMMSLKPPAPAVIRPDFNNNGTIQARMNQVLPPGSDPFLDQMMAILNNVEPESPEAQQAQARIAARWAQLGRSNQGLQELFVLQAIRSLNNVSGSLSALSGNLEPQSLEAMQLQNRISAINGIKGNLVQQWQNLQA